MTPEIVTMEIDCHDHPYHVVDAEYPECGPENLIRIAETYGILIKFLPEHSWSEWAWWYEVTGPREHIVRFLTDEFTGAEPEARELVECGAVEVAT